jgi:membrane protease YdiL (CAAX protease family)
MERLKVLADRRPLAFALLAILGWLLAGGVLALVSAALLQVPLIAEGPQMVGTLGATLILLVIAWRLGWLPGIGIAGVGSWRVWALVLPLLVYLLAAYWLGFFGDLSFDLGVFTRSESARAILRRQAIVGFVEETLFRGIVLFVLIRAWGGSRRGLVAALLTQAALFGVLHLLQVGMGSSLSEVLMVVLNSLVSGIWWGATALVWQTVWPAVLFHSASNAAVQIKGLTDAAIQPSVTAYAGLLC